MNQNDKISKLQDCLLKYFSGSYPSLHGSDIQIIPKFEIKNNLTPSNLTDNEVEIDSVEEAWEIITHLFPEISNSHESITEKKINKEASMILVMHLPGIQ